MSFQYDQYLTQHRSNVKRGFDWIAENLPELLVDGFDYCLLYTSPSPRD